MTKDALTGLNFDKILTPSEQRIAESIARGLGNSQISSILGVKTNKFISILNSLKTKLGASTNKEIVLNALRQGLIKKPSSWVRGATLPPHNPFTGPAGTSTMHANTASSDATLNRGPGIGGNYKIISVNGWGSEQTVSTDFPYAVPTVLMPDNGGLVCVGVGNSAINAKIPSVLLVSPLTLAILDTQELVKPESGDLAGGIYSYIDNLGNLVLVNGSGYLQWYGTDYDMATDTGGITLQKSININQPMVVSLAPDYEGKIWFATQGNIDSSGEAAVVGFYDSKSEDIATFQLPAGEMVANSISSSPAGIAVATTKALYMLRYSRAKGDVKQIWRYEYQNSGDRKPGQLSPGTGATPVFFGPKTGFEYVAITDNAAQDNGSTPAENFNVYLTAKATAGKDQLLASIPFLGTQNSGTENAPIAVGKSVFSPSTYGYWYPPSAETPSTSVPSSFDLVDFPGGIQRIDLASGNPRKGGNWQSQWTQNVQSAALPRLSIADEQIYTITGGYSSASHTGSEVQYYFAAIDPATGISTNLVELGTNTWEGGVPQVALTDTYNNNPLQMTGVISPDGVFYQGMASGLFSVEGPQPRYGTGITTNGYAFTNGVSFDGAGNTYSQSAIGSAIQDGQLIWNGVKFAIGKANQLSFAWANGQQYSVQQGAGLNILNIAAASIGGATISEDITINFTDGTSTVWNQAFSDWRNPDYNVGESIISQQTYFNTSSGGSCNAMNYIYGYSYMVPSGKSVESIALPFQYKLRALGIAMSSSNSDLAGASHLLGIGNRLDDVLKGRYPKNKQIGGMGNDVLTGGPGLDSFLYNDFKKSILSGYDEIVNYAAGDKINVAIDSFKGGSLASSVGNVPALNAEGIGLVLADFVFLANKAAAFTVDGLSGTFLALNDDRAGYQADTDALIHLSNYTIGSETPIAIA